MLRVSGCRSARACDGSVLSLSAERTRSQIFWPTNFCLSRSCSVSRRCPTAKTPQPEMLVGSGLRTVRAKDGGAGGSATAQGRREVPDFLSWIQCFGAYACIVAAVQPEKTQQLLAYQTMVVREARRCGGTGWQAYDTMFRQQVSNDPKSDWSRLNSSLYAVTFLAQQNGIGKSCLYCLETDHAASKCALAPSKPQHPPNQEAKKYLTRAKSERSPKVCYSWNDGRCAVPYCRYRHICAKCQGDQKALHCGAYPASKPFPPMKGGRKEGEGGAQARGL